LTPATSHRFCYGGCTPPPPPQQQQQRSPANCNRQLDPLEYASGSCGTAVPHCWSQRPHAWGLLPAHHQQHTCCMAALQVGLAASHVKTACRLLPSTCV
jgi:hypothetical protein